MKVKKKTKKLTLDEAENKLLNIISGHLATLSVKKAEQRIKEIHKVTLDSDNRGTGSRSREPHSTFPIPLLARKH